jgi:hypothetical protein
LLPTLVVMMQWNMTAECSLFSTSVVEERPTEGSKLLVRRATDDAEAILFTFFLVH